MVVAAKWADCEFKLKEGLPEDFDFAAYAETHVDSTKCLACVLSEDGFRADSRVSSASRPLLLVLNGSLRQPYAFQGWHAKPLRCGSACEPSAKGRAARKGAHGAPSLASSDGEAATQVREPT